MFKLTHAKEQLTEHLALIHALTARVTKLEKEQVATVQDLAALQTQIDTVIPAAVAALNTAVTIIQGFQNGTTNADDPAVEAFITDAKTQLAALETATSSVAAVETPPASSTPSGGSTPTS